MFPMTVLWFLFATLFGMVPSKTAEEVARDAGATCERGCVVGPNDFVYEVQREDIVIMARAASCEFASVLSTEDADAAIWALTSNFARRRMLGRNETFAGFIMGYSGCTGTKWSSVGTRHSDRITPKADANRQLRWRDIPQRTRDYVRAFFRGEVPNRMPWTTFVLTNGWQKHADPSWIGPYVARTHGPRSWNLYWADRSTRFWTTATVRLVPPTAVSAEARRPAPAPSTP